MSTTESPYLTLSQVAVQTGRHPELLRQWCAAGRLPCTRVGGSWVLRERDLALVSSIARRTRGGDVAPLSPGDAGGSRVIAAVFDDETTAAEVATALRDRLELPERAVGLTYVELPGAPSLRLCVVAGRFADLASIEARRLLVGYGGRIVADIDESGTRGDGARKSGRRTVARAARRRRHQPSPGAATR
jgi:helix-turn-helix protein